MSTSLERARAATHDVHLLHNKILEATSHQGDF